MTREEKIEKRKKRAHRRKLKKIDELKQILNLVDFETSFYRARSYIRNNYTAFQCEMGYSDCEQRGYCNGDC